MLAVLAVLALTAGPLPPASASRDPAAEPGIVEPGCPVVPILAGSSGDDERVLAQLLSADPMELAVGCLFPSGEVEAAGEAPAAPPSPVDCRVDRAPVP